MKADESPRVVSLKGKVGPLDVFADAKRITDDIAWSDETASTNVVSASSVEQLMKPLRPYLDDPRVMELCINRPGELFLETSEGWIVTQCASMDYAACVSLAGAIATATEQSVSEHRPLLSATLETQERVQIVLPPSVEKGLCSYTFRKPSKQIWTLADFSKQGLFGTASDVVRTKTLTTAPLLVPGAVKLWTDTPEEVYEHQDLLEPFEISLLQMLWSGRYAEFMKSAVLHRRNLAVAGATGSGKTTFMKGIMQECPRSERLITIEDAREIFLPNHPNKVHLLYSKGGQGVSSVDATKLLVSCLRMKPDRILLAEIREGECYDFLRVAASGHPGSITSLHAGTCMEAFEQMGLMIRQSPAGAGLSHPETQRLLRLLLDVIVQYAKHDGRRRVTEIFYRPLQKKRLTV